MTLPVMVICLHQLLLCWDAGIADANLTLKRHEFRPIIDLRYGPFSAQAHHSVLMSVAAGYFSTEQWGGPLFTLFFDDICRRRPRR